MQAELTRLTGIGLALDGDLLAYQRNGEPSGDESASERAWGVLPAPDDGL